MLIKEAKKITGGLSASQAKCLRAAITCQRPHARLAAKLRQIPGTPCHGCYAFKFRYNFSSHVKAALARRLASPGPIHEMGGGNDNTS